MIVVHREIYKPLVIPPFPPLYICMEPGFAECVFQIIMRWNNSAPHNLCPSVAIPSLIKGFKTCSAFGKVHMKEDEQAIY
jgi:hypothetical protein